MVCIGLFLFFCSVEPLTQWYHETLGDRSKRLWFISKVDYRCLQHPSQSKIVTPPYSLWCHTDTCHRDDVMPRILVAVRDRNLRSYSLSCGWDWDYLTVPAWRRRARPGTPDSQRQWSVSGGGPRPQRLTCGSPSVTHQHTLNRQEIHTPCTVPLRLAVTRCFLNDPGAARQPPPHTHTLQSLCWLHCAEVLIEWVSGLDMISLLPASSGRTLWTWTLFCEQFEQFCRWY